MNKREVVLSLLDAGAGRPYTPAGFFIHFDKSCHRGQAAVDKHLEYFRYTGMDFVKIQYENSFPQRPEIVKPGDWAKMPFLGQEFYEGQLEVVEGLVKAARKEALVLVTLYSPFMCAGQTVGADRLVEQIKENPERVKQGLEVVTDSLMLFVKECIRLGVDGFYHSTQGGESYRFEGSPLFDECVRPYDLALMEEINQACIFNILHICDYHGGYTDLSPFLDYPGHVVNCSLKLGAKELTGAEVSRLFGRPFMGGLERKGTIVSGSVAEIEAAVEAALANAPMDYMLGADCTLPGDIDWENIRAAISAAHLGGG